MPLGGRSVPVSYSYSPGEEHDGVTLKLDPALAQSLSPASVEWAVPGLREAQIGELLRALPKGLRRQLMPFPPKVAEIARDLRPGEHSLLHDLARFIHCRYGVEVPLSSWPAQALPPHLRPRPQGAPPQPRPSPGRPRPSPTPPRLGNGQTRAVRRPARLAPPGPAMGAFRFDELELRRPARAVGR